MTIPLSDYEDDQVLLNTTDGDESDNDDDAEGFLEEIAVKAEEEEARIAGLDSITVYDEKCRRCVHDFMTDMIGEAQKMSRESAFTIRSNIDPSLWVYMHRLPPTGFISTSTDTLLPMTKRMLIRDQITPFRSHRKSLSSPEPAATSTITQTAKQPIPLMRYGCASDAPLVHNTTKTVNPLGKLIPYSN